MIALYVCGALLILLLIIAATDEGRMPDVPWEDPAPEANTEEER